MTSLLASSVNNETNDGPVKYIVHVEMTRYPDGRVFAGKSWVTENGKVKSKKKKVSKFKLKKQEDILL